ncbi:iron complex transport system ATP-binding protein [Algoriphagus faecimaris]|uniref:Iron complex transport system ATP-binding protein n=1 Tax=Algoriphagus faecimaris TaxID=686796 RepID=A0A1G6VZV9_9BACT|nr:ABC transporter ATP-binding protein [Algoriphagus faecimaris]SDD58325.1 iron complex transport system ATP-binding protein [Algoriphagus faecimaris]
MAEARLVGKNISLGYPNKDAPKVVLEALNFELCSGQLTCLLGPNGVGKSTLIKAMMGQLIPLEGRLELDGKRVSDFSYENLSKQLSVVLSEPQLPSNLTVEQLVGLGRTPYLTWSGSLSQYDKEIVQRALSTTHIEYLRKELIGEISDGQRQKAMIARAVAQDCPLMILDEPTAHLDLVNRYEIMRLLQQIAHQEQKAILVVTHDLEIALETADYFWLLTCGAPLLGGLPEDLVISGSINQLYPSGTYRFDQKRGRVEFESDTLEWSVTGEEELIFWLKKSLIKAGIKKIQSPVKVMGKPFTIDFEGESFSKLETFLQFLQLKND